MNQLTELQKAAMLHIKDGADIYPAHRELARQLAGLAECGLVLIADPITNDPGAICSVNLTITGREAIGLQGICETCGLYDHHLITGMCPACNKRWPHANDQAPVDRELAIINEISGAFRDD